jgi:putative ABC transport system permease protein
LASVIVFPFSAYIGIKLELPYLQPGFGIILALLVLSLLLTFVIGPLTALYSAVKVGRAETYATIREGE